VLPSAVSLHIGSAVAPPLEDGPAEASGASPPHRRQRGRGRQRGCHGQGRGPPASGACPSRGAATAPPAATGSGCATGNGHTAAVVDAASWTAAPTAGGGACSSRCCAWAGEEHCHGDLLLHLLLLLQLLHLLLVV